MCRLFPCIPIFRGFFSIKKYKKKCVCVVVVKIALLLVKSVFIDVKKGMRELGCSLALIHTTVSNFFTSIVNKVWHSDSWVALIKVLKILLTLSNNE